MRFANYLRFLSVLAVLMAGIGCHARRDNVLPTVTDRSRCSNITEYFPPAGTPWTTGFHFGDEWGESVSQILKMMHEPSLYWCEAGVPDAQYRFIWIRSFNDPIAIRLSVHANGTGTLFIHSLKGWMAGYPPKPGINSTREITSDQTKHALELFKQIDFMDKRNRFDISSTDGSNWIFEANEGGRYQLVEFRDPTPEAQRFGLYLMLDLAKLPLTKDEIY